MTPAPAPLSLRTPAPLVRLLLVLSASAGMVDAVSLLGMERVLASNIAGNLVFAALAGAGVPGFALLPCCTALAAYAAGAAAAGSPAPAAPAAGPAASLAWAVLRAGPRLGLVVPKRLARRAVTRVGNQNRTGGDNRPRDPGLIERIQQG